VRSGDNDQTAQSLTDTSVTNPILSSNGKYSSKIKTSASIASAATHSSSSNVGNRPNSFSPNGTSGMVTATKTSPLGMQENTSGGTLMDLKRRRARRSHGLSLFCLDSKDEDEEGGGEQDKSPTRDSSGNISRVPDISLLISNGTLPHSEGSGSELRHKFVNNDEVIHGETNGCCIIM